LISIGRLPKILGILVLDLPKVPRTYRALPIGPIGPYKGPIQAPPLTRQLKLTRQLCRLVCVTGHVSIKSRPVACSFARDLACRLHFRCIDIAEV